MSHEVLQSIVGMAVIDERFRRKLLQNPEAVLDDFELVPDEIEAVTAIEAETITEFAQELHNWMISRNGHADEGARLKEALVTAVSPSRAPGDREAPQSMLR